MTVEPAPRRAGVADRGVRPSWGALADTVGYCVLVFAFAPALASFPRWLYFEARNPLNAHDSVVLAFVPVRGIVLLLSSFSSGAVQGVLAGVIYGVLVSTWLSWRGHAPTARRRTALGAIAGGLAACLVMLVVVTVAALGGSRVTWRGSAIAFGIATGTLCGVVAARTAVRLLLPVPDEDPRAGRNYPPRASVAASQ